MKKKSLFLFKDHFLYLSGIFLVSRLFLFLLALLINTFFDYNHPISEIFCTWDCGWYMSIVKEGYNAVPFFDGSGRYNFFPMFPLIVKGIASFSQLQAIPSAIIINNILFFLSVLLIYKYTYEYIQPSLAKITSAFLVFSPYSFYFSIGLSESLYLFLMLSVFLCAQSRYWIATGMLGAGLSATRVPGVLSVLSLLPIILSQFKIKDIIRIRPITYKLWIGMLLFPMGLFLFMLHLHYRVGDALAFLHVRIAWGFHQFKGPFVILGNNLFNWGYGSYTSILSIFAIFCGFFLIKKSYVAEGILLLIGILLPLMTQIDSMQRYIFVLFPFYIALAMLTQNKLLFQKILLGFMIIMNSVTLWGWIAHKGFVV